MSVVGWAIKAFVLAHLVPILGLVAVVLVVFVFGPARTLAALRTRTGNVVVALVVAALAGWYAHAAVSDTVALSRQLAAQQDAAKVALAEEKARTAIAVAQAAAARRQAEDQHAVAVADAQRAEATERARADLAEQVADYEDDIAADDRAGLAARKAATGCKLTAAGAAALAGLGAPRVKPHR